MRFVITLLCFCFLTTTYAQVANLYGAGNAVIREKKFEGIDGSPYLHSDWAQGSIVNVDGKEFKDVLINYDSYSDKLLILRDGQQLSLDSRMYPAFTMRFYDEKKGNMVSYFFKNGFVVESLKETNYFQVLHESKAKLLKRVYTVLEEQRGGNYGTNELTKRFTSKSSYYIQHPDGGVEEIKTTKKDFYKSFGSSAEYMKGFAKKEKVNIKQEPGLIKLLIEYERVLN